jgi:hypothetical protein
MGGFTAGNAGTLQPLFGQIDDNSQVNTAGVTGVGGSSNPGVRGTSRSGDGVIGSSQGGDGVRGETVTGVGVEGLSKDGTGVRGASAKTGVAGITSSDTDAGVNGENTGKGFGVFGGSDDGHGVEGHSVNGIGVVGFCENPTGLAGRFIGNVEVTGNLIMSSQTSDITLGDVAEGFSTQDGEIIEPGTVVVLNQHGLVRPGNEAYDKKVAGVVSGAGDYRPAIVLDRQLSQASRLPVALMGKVCCKVDAQYSPIEVGDLLTTSATLGHAMKATDPLKAFGSVIGKALRPLNAGQGIIPILIALQ